MQLAACATPFVSPVAIGNETKLTCSELKEERQKAEYHMDAARSEDRFKLSYILVLPAIISVNRMAEAESAAYKRVSYLNEVMQLKGCNRMR